jgi:hypothetical protein
VAVSFDVDSREFRRALKLVVDGTEDFKAVNAEAAQVVERDVRVPVVSGRLAASIRSTGQARTGVVRAGSAGVPYAGVIHYGWPKRNIRANPFLTSALDRQEDAVVDVYRDGVADLIRRHNLG